MDADTDDKTVPNGLKSRGLIDITKDYLDGRITFETYRGYERQLAVTVTGPSFLESADVRGAQVHEVEQAHVWSGRERP
jgi:hypothetical protein